MKKVLFAMLILASFTSQAQKGDILVGGNIGYSSNNNSGISKTSNFTFTPTVGYFFSNTWSGGLVANIGSGKVTDETTTPNTVTNSSNFAIGPYVRYTQNISKIFGIYYQAQGLFGSSKYGGAKTSTTNINLFPAIFLNVKNGFGLNASFGGINFGSSKPSGGSSDNSFNISLGQVLSVGVSKSFGTSKSK